MIFAPTRRGFLQALGALVGTGLAAPAFAARRDPFVEVGEHVDSIVFHLWDEHRPIAPTGPLAVHAVGEWDGTGYPITLRQFNYGRPPTLYDGWYDFEWSNLRRDVPAQFWHSPARRDRYPNVHSYVREQRFGEDPDVMRRIMDANRLRGPTGRRAVAVGRERAA